MTCLTLHNFCCGKRLPKCGWPEIFGMPLSAGLQYITWKMPIMRCWILVSLGKAVTAATGNVKCAHCAGSVGTQGSTEMLHPLHQRHCSVCNFLRNIVRHIRMIALRRNVILEMPVWFYWKGAERIIDICQLMQSFCKHTTAGNIYK